MYTYKPFEWIFVFYVYCFLGWIIESSIVSFKQKRFVNRGFLKSPLLPIYGTGAVMVLVICLPLKSDPLTVFVVGMFSATILEYITGWLMEKVFKIKYWDYSEDKFNFQGRICLESSLFWGVLSLVLTYFINKPIENIVISIDSIVLNFITIIISCVFISDVVYSTCNIIHFSKTLTFMKKLKSEIEAINKEIGKVNKSWSNKSEYILGKKLKELLKEYDSYTSKIRKYHRNLIRTYPKVSSRYFKNELKELRDKIEMRFSTRKSK